MDRFWIPLDSRFPLIAHERERQENPRLRAWMSSIIPHHLTT